MQDHASRHQSDPAGIPTKPNVPLGGTLKAPAKCQGAARSGNPKTKSRRIIVRVTDERYQALMARSRELDCDLSHVVRSALDGSLKPETAPSAARKPLLRPAEIDPLVDHYRAVVDEDIRKMRKRLFDQLLAVSYVCKERYPRTSGVVDGYQSLLSLQSLFGYPENV
jgi:hypothetical protein